MIDSIRNVLSNTFLFGMKCQTYHWNVTGNKFIQLHNYFEELYDDAFDSMDVIAELLRMENVYAPKSIAELYTYTDINEDDEVPTSYMVMISNIINDNEIVINSLLELIEESDDEHVLDIAIGRLSKHKKYRWFLTSLLK